jgi:hypothetical protein
LVAPKSATTQTEDAQERIAKTSITASEELRKDIKELQD